MMRGVGVGSSAKLDPNGRSSELWRIDNQQQITFNMHVVVYEIP